MPGGRYVSSLSVARLRPRRHGLYSARRVNTETQRVAFRTVRPARIARTAFRPEAIPNPDAQRLSSTECMRNARRSVGRASLPFLLHPFPLRTRAPPHEHSAYTPLHSVQVAGTFCTTRFETERRSVQLARRWSVSLVPKSRFCLNHRHLPMAEALLSEGVFSKEFLPHVRL